MKTHLKIIILLFILISTPFHPVRATTLEDIKLSLNMKNAPLGKILDEIEAKTGYNYIIRTNDIDLQEQITIHVKNKSLAEVLGQIFKGRDITYEIKDKRISIYRPQRSTAQPVGAIRQITGTVVDKNKEPLMGVSVVVKGTTRGIITDINGFFTLNIEGDPELEISYIGFVKQTISTAGKTVLHVQLAEDIHQLDDVVVIGYGTLSKKELTSAISHISSEQFLNIGSADPIMQIQGKVAGVSITNQAASDPNQSANIQVRGISSRSAGNEPLVVIDGVMGGNLMNVNQNDIESIDILKDGAASAIYGTQGSNGVILITTKKGAQDGSFHTSYSAYTSVDLIQQQLKPLSADEFRTYRVPDGQIDYGHDTDWFDAISRNGFAHSHTITFSGGNAQNNYRASVDYRYAHGLELRSDREEYGARVSLNHTTKNKLLKFTVNIAPRIVNRSNSSWAVFNDALTMNPTMPVMDPNDPSMYYDTNIAPFNVVEKLNLELDGKETKFLNGDATVRLNLLPLLAPEQLADHSLSTQLTYAQQINDDFNYTFRPSTSSAARYEGRTGEASRGYYKDVKRSLEWILNYAYEKNGHTARFMGGYSYLYEVYSSLYAANADFDSDALTYNNLANGLYNKEEGRNDMSSNKYDSKLISFFGRVTYDYKSRYMATASLRYEGSSKFGANNKWGYFPAASVGWRISEEEFMKNLTWINDLKIRADIGVTGNQDFGNYNSLATMRAFGTYFYQGELFNVWGWSKNVNPDLKWEKGVNWNIGVDFSMFRNRLNGSLNYYNRKQSDLLGTYNVPVPPNLFSTTFVNVGTMRNTGLEVEVNVDAIKTRDIHYNVGVVASTNKNKFLDFSNVNYQGQDSYKVCSMTNPNNPGYLQRIEKGESIGNYFTYAYAGISEEGEWLVWNKDNTEQILIGDATEEDKRITGNGLPKFNLSLTNTFRYKNIDLSVYLRGAFGFDLFNVHDFYYGLQSKENNVLKRAYTKNYEVTKGMNQLSDYFIENGNYLKLDVVSVGYTFNLDSNWVDRVRVYATGKNLYTFTKFTGVDPSTYPVNGLTPGTFGGDKRYYPTAIQLLFGIQIDF